MDRYNHISPLSSISRRSAHALREGFKAKRLEHELIESQSQISFSKAIEKVPEEIVLCHELVQADVVVERPKRSIIRVNVHNITLKLSRIKYIKSISEGIGRRSVAATSIGHENLNSADIVI
jgi:hypothetical protein